MRVWKTEEILKPLLLLTLFNWLSVYWRARDPTERSHSAQSLLRMRGALLKMCTIRSVEWVAERAGDESSPPRPMSGSPERCGSEFAGCGPRCRRVVHVRQRQPSPARHANYVVQRKGCRSSGLRDQSCSPVPFETSSFRRRIYGPSGTKPGTNKATIKTTVTL